MILMDTPYRLPSLLRDLAEAFGTRRMCIAYNLTMSDEKIFHGTAESLFKLLGQKEGKGEYVVVVEGKSASTRVSH